MPSTVRTGFLEGPNGKLHISIFLPAHATSLRGCVVHVPAFAEEMNKCRPMICRQARRLAEDGVAVIVPDLTGTGDSEGEFSSASWLAWRADLAFMVGWSRDLVGREVVLWGARLGCLLVLDALADVGSCVSALLLWQPVLSGKQHLAQFLRLRMAADLMRGGGESVAQLREQLLAGQEIEVAGYPLSPALFSQLEGVVAADLEIPSHIRIEVHEVVADPGKGVLPVTQKQVEQWTHRDIPCAVNTVSGSPFWMTQEIALAPALLEPACSFVLAQAAAAEKDRVHDLDVGGLHSALDSQLVATSERSVIFTCEGEELVARLHEPQVASSRGVVLVVGGPQYRVGSHRQFVQIARYLCDQGIPVLRFDYRGMGDSSGELLGFQHALPDIRCAIDTFQRECKTLTDIVLWGLCDAATAAVFYAQGDSRVKALVLVNPWVYSTQGAAKAFLKHYYLRRFFSKAFWKKVLSGGFRPVKSATSAAKMVGSAIDDAPGSGAAASDSSPDGKSADLVELFASGLGQFSGSVLVILSGNDLTAAEFRGAAESHRGLRRLMRGKMVHRATLEEADHTFSRREWSSEVELLTVEMVRKL